MGESGGNSEKLLDFNFLWNIVKSRSNSQIYCYLRYLMLPLGGCGPVVRLLGCDARARRSVPTAEQVASHVAPS